MPHEPRQTLTGSHLDVRAVARYAATPTSGFRIDREARERVRASRDTVERVAVRRPVYGRTTGVGANRRVAVPADVRQDLRLLKSHATGSGNALPSEQVRAAMLIRLNQLLAGGSGMHPGIVDALVEALDDGDLPRVREFGSVGTGDLSSFAEIGLGLAGLAPLESGRSHAYWTPHDGDALAFMSTNAMTVAAGCLATASARQWHDHALAVGCLSLIAVRGSAEALAPPVHDARPHSGQAETAARLRTLLDGHAPEPARVQDSYGFRAIAQVEGTVRHTLEAGCGVLNTEMNAASENPLVSTPDDDVFHNGNFHSLPIALAFDQTKLAVSSAAHLASCRLTDMSEPEMTGLEPFLADGLAGSSGTMLLEYNAAAALARIRSSAAPATLGTTVVSRGTEDHAGFAAQGAEQLGECVRDAGVVAACELITAVRALRQSGRSLERGTPLGDYFRRAAELIEPDTADRPLSDDLDRVVSFVRGPAGLPEWEASVD